jgi:hypothetical protein
MVLNLGVKMLTTKYKIEDDRFLFKAIYDDESNIIYNHHEDKQTGEVFVADNLGELDGKVKFDPSTIDDYVQKAIGAAFPIMVDDVGFVFTYDDLEARKDLIGQEKFNEIVAKYPRLVKKLRNIDKYTKVIYRVETSYNFVTKEQTSRIIFDNTKENWWSSEDTPEELSTDVFTPDELMYRRQTLMGIVYMNPIERYIWNVINMIPKID